MPRKSQNVLFHYTPAEIRAHAVCDARNALAEALRNLKDLPAFSEALDQAEQRIKVARNAIELPDEQL